MEKKVKTYNIEVSDHVLNYMITGLEFYCIFLNNVYYIVDMDIDIRNEQYADCFYIYHYLMNLSDGFRTRIRLEKPKTKTNINDNILHFKSKDNNLDNKLYV